MKTSIILFDDFTDLDLFVLWDLLKRVEAPDWSVKILGEKDAHVSATNIEIKTHGFLSERCGRRAFLQRQRNAPENDGRKFSFGVQARRIETNHRRLGLGRASFGRARLLERKNRGELSVAGNQNRFGEFRRARPGGKLSSNKETSPPPRSVSAAQIWSAG